jgi:hypothetical protein
MDTDVAVQGPQIHIRYDGRSFEFSMTNLDIGNQSGDDQIKAAVAGYLDVPVEKLRNYRVERETSGNLTIRPEAFFGLKDNFSDITLVVDRSGSMQSIRTDMVGGMNHFLDEQKKVPGDCLFTMCQFDTEYEFVHRAVPIRDVPPLDLVPRGYTALLDAVGRSINETGKRLETMPEDQRPSKVVMVVITDGLENSSKEFTKGQIKEMVERQTKYYGWQFVYLGANQDAFAEAGSMGFAPSNVMQYTASPLGTRGMHLNAAQNIAAYRRGERTSAAFSPEERAKQAAADAAHK